MQAIETKFLGPTNTRGARIMAQCLAKRRFFGYAHELSIDDNHRVAAIALYQELGWMKKGERLVSGTLRSGVQCHVIQDWTPPRV